MLSTDAQERKDTPVYSGFMCYFPDAIAEVARLSKAGNDQHNPGSDLHWDRSKSGDELDSLMRHLLDNASEGEDIEHLRAVAWRAMAQLQKACERRYLPAEWLKDCPSLSTFTPAEETAHESSKPQKNAPPVCDCGSIGPPRPGHWHAEKCPLNAAETRYERMLREGQLNEYNRGNVHEQMRELRLKDD